MSRWVRSGHRRRGAAWRHVTVINHVELVAASYSGDVVRLKLHNPYSSLARVKPILDPDPSQPWDDVWKARTTVVIEPGETRQVELLAPKLLESGAGCA